MKTLPKWVSRAVYARVVRKLAEKYIEREIDTKELVEHANSAGIPFSTVCAVRALPRKPKKSRKE